MNATGHASSIKKFFIFGYFGWFNAGDDAIGIAIINEMKKKYPRSELFVTSNFSYFFDKNNFLSSIHPVTYSSFSIMKAIFSSDEVIIAGGTHFQDDDESRVLKLKIFGFFFLMSVFSALIKKRPILFGHGIGPLSSEWTKFLVKGIFYCAKWITVRDTDSFAMVSSMGFERKCTLGFDVAALLFKEGSAINKPDVSPDNFILGMSLLPFYDVYSKNQSMKDYEVMENISTCIKEILKRENSFEIRLFAFRSGTRHSDEEILLRLYRSLEEYALRVKIIIYNGDLTTIIFELSQCSGVIGMRYHAALFTYLLQKPLVIIDYQKKCLSLAKDIGLPPDAVISLQDLTTPLLCRSIKRIIRNPESHQSKLPVEQAINRAQLPFDELQAKFYGR